MCDTTPDGRLVLLLRGPRGGREAVVLRTDRGETACRVPVADGDPWIGRFSPDGRMLYLRSDADREFAALVAVELGPDGAGRRRRVIAQRDGVDLELLSVRDDGRSAVLAWNVRGRTELEVLALPVPVRRRAGDGVGAKVDGGHAPPELAPRSLPLTHEVVTRISPAGPRGLALAVSGSVRRPGIWHGADGGSPVRTPWSSRDEDAVAPGRPPERPEHLRLRARDGLELGGWYYAPPGATPTTTLRASSICTAARSSRSGPSSIRSTTSCSATAWTSSRPTYAARWVRAAPSSTPTSEPGGSRRSTTSRTARCTWSPSDSPTPGGWP